MSQKVFIATIHRGHWRKNGMLFWKDSETPVGEAGALGGQERRESECLWLVSIGREGKWLLVHPSPCGPAMPADEWKQVWPTCTHWKGSSYPSWASSSPASCQLLAISEKGARKRSLVCLFVYSVGCWAFFPIGGDSPWHNVCDLPPGCLKHSGTEGVFTQLLYEDNQWHLSCSFLSHSMHCVFS